jgi:hypothetical protein
MNLINIQKKDRLEVKEAGNWQPKPWTGQERRNFNLRPSQEKKKFFEVSFPHFVTEEIEEEY